MSFEMKIGLSAIDSYRRLDYTPWHAIAEFVDNSTQFYFDNKNRLDEIYEKEGLQLEVGIAYDGTQDGGFLRIVDNAMGMSYDDLERALHVARPPSDPTGRCCYGMGMKTAACWIGNRWVIRTKKLGETTEYTVQVNVEDISKGKAALPTQQKGEISPEDHYTIVEIFDHNRQFKGRTLGKIKDHLRSMYRQDFRKGLLKLEWQQQPLSWEELDNRLMVDREGKPYKRDFEFYLNGKRVHGWAGIFGERKAARADAGFSILHSDRVVRGWPDSWRPEKIYGYQRNDLLNQRLVGEIHLGAFEVTHTKDNIQWLGDEEEIVEKKLSEKIQDYIRIARATYSSLTDDRGPSEAEIDTAISELRDELTSKEMIDQIEISVVPSEEAVRESFARIAKPMKSREPKIGATIGDLEISVYVAGELSASDPYVVLDTASSDKVILVINAMHPHMSQIEGSAGVTNYFRHCIYDAIAEWQARKKTARIDPNTVKLLKDGLLRVSLIIESHASEDMPAPMEEAST